jgi:hypothetical protein
MLINLRMRFPCAEPTLNPQNFKKFMSILMSLIKQSHTIGLLDVTGTKNVKLV